MIPHLRHAIQINRMLSQSNIVSNYLADEMNIAAISLDAKGRVIAASEAAQQLLHQPDGFLLTGQHLSASDLAQNALLQETIATAISASRANQSPSNQSPSEKQPDLKPPAKSRQGKTHPYRGCLAVSRSSSKHPLQVVVHPLHSSELLLENRPCALVIAIDPNRKITAPAAALRALYGLTPSESRLVELLLQGHELSESAELLGNSIAGARVRLKSIMRKTNVSRQSELMRLFVGFPKSEALRNS